MMMRTLLNLIITTLYLLGTLSQAQAAKPGKAVVATKEHLVLMSLRVGEKEKNMQASMETALVQGLQQRYEVFSGEDVAQKAKAIFNKESRSAKKECDETRCMQDIAIAFQAELVATANVTKIEGGYLLALNIRNVMDNKAVYSNSMPCEKCSMFQVVEKLKELSGSTVPETRHSLSPTEMPLAQSGKSYGAETALWNEVKNSNLIEDYQTYLAQYPLGKYAATARLRVKKLQDSNASEAAGTEQQIWRAAEQAGDEASYQNYLKDYPQGNYAGLAQVRIHKLQSADQAAQQEQALWHTARDGYSIQAVQAYLDQYPDGKYVELAKSRIKKLRKDEVVAKQQTVQTEEPQSAADRLKEAEAAGRVKEKAQPREIVVPQYLKKIIPEIVHKAQQALD